MAEYIHFIPPKNLSAPASGTSGVCGFVSSQEVIAATVSADTMADWISLDTQYLAQNSFIYTVSPNTTGAERTAVISIAAKVQPEGSAEQIVDYDIATLRQESQNSGTGSILPQYTSFTPKAEGDSGTCTFTTSNIIPSTISISCDSSYADIGYLTNSSGIKTGFTWSVGENNTVSSRQFTVTINARRASGDGYAYAYVSGVQPSIDNVGYILFDADTVRASADTVSSSIGFETNQVSAITSAYTTNYWLHVVTTTIDIEDDPRYVGTLVYQIDANPYNFGRTGQITMYGRSNVDESIVQTTLHFYQAADPSGTTQLGYITCDNPVIILNTPDAMSSTTICQFNLSYNDYVDRTTISASTEGNFSGTPQFHADSTILTFVVNNATSDTDYTQSVIYVSAKDTSERTIPPIVLTVIQPPYFEYIEFPIWKDTDLVINNDTDYLLYQITINNDIVYNGRAYTMNGQVTIRLNEIMEQVLLPDLDITQEGLQDNNAYANAVLSVSLDGGLSYQKYKQIKTYADWSYKEITNNILSRPIKKEVDRRQLFLCSAMDYAGGGPTIVVSFTDEEDSVDNVYSLSNKIGTVVQRIGSANEITVLAGEDEMVYNVIDGCKRYCLYYLNACGGWDSYIFQNQSKESDDFNRLTYSTNINNQTPRHKKIEYKNKIQKKWTLKTGYLNDEQSLILAEHMMGSPCAYLHDLAEDKIYPVLITSKSTDYQTYVRNGRKFSRYDITVELAQERKRR